MGLAIDKELAEAGYKMLGMSDRKEELILDILRTKNERYLKAIPFLIYTYNPNMNRILQKTENKKLAQQIIAVTRQIFIDETIRINLPPFDNQGDLNYREFLKEFESQRKKPELLIDKERIYAERNLQMQLSQLFTKKEKQIIIRIMEDKPISRTDYEYYSRKTRKKLNSIISLQEFALTLSAKRPSYDEELFYLKKLLEEWLGEEEITVKRYFLWDHNHISISYTQKDSESLGYNTQRKLRDIKDKEILELLKKYPEHDFT